MYPTAKSMGVVVSMVRGGALGLDLGEAGFAATGETDSVRVEQVV